MADRGRFNSTHCTLRNTASKDRIIVRNDEKPFDDPFSNDEFSTMHRVYCWLGRGKYFHITEKFDTMRIKCIEFDKKKNAPLKNKSMRKYFLYPLYVILNHAW